MSSTTSLSESELAVKLVDEILQDFWVHGFDGHLIRITVSPEFKKLLDKSTITLRESESKVETVSQVVEVFDTDIGRLEIAVDERTD